MKRRAAALLLLAAALPACDPGSADVLNAVFLDGVTPASPNASQLPTFNGRSDSGAFIEIFNNPGGTGAPLSTTTASSAGTFAVTVSVPKPSQRTYYAFATPLRGSRTGPSNGLAYASRDGGFQAQVTYAVGIQPAWLAVGLFNADAFLDLAVPGFTDDTVTILLGVGDGTFTAGTPLAGVGTSPSSIVAGDFNGDTLIDLAVGNNTANTITIIVGNGDGTFALPGTTIALASQVLQLTGGDLDGDLDLDLVAVSSGGNSITVLLGANDGTFTAAIPTAAGNSPFEAVLADLDGGLPDLLIPNQSGGSVTVLLNGGGGVFAPAVAGPVTAGIQPRSVATGDFDRNGRTDMAVANSGSNTLSIFLGNGSGGFAAAATPAVATGNQPIVARSGDFNSDGLLDLITSDSNSDALSFLAGDGTGAFAAAVPLSVGSFPRGMVVADFNRDGLPDIAVVNQNGNNVSVLLAK